MLPIFRATVACGLFGLQALFCHGQGVSELRWEDLPDFSHAGYEGGGVPLPHVPVRITVSPGAGDDTARIQNALDAAGQLPRQADGFRGAVLLTSGTYQVTTGLSIDVDGVVLRGEGEASTIIEFDGPNRSAQVIRVGGAIDDNWETQVPGTLTAITTPLVKLGAYSFEISNPGGFQVGDEIVIWHEARSEWFELVEQGGVIDDVPWEEQNDWRDVRYRRIIKHIRGNRVTVDAPMYMELDSAYADLWIYKYDRPSHREHIGVEDLTIDIVTASKTDESQVGTGIYFQSADNCWAKRVTVKNFWSNGFRLSGTVHITIEDCKAIEPHSVLRSTRRYNFVTSAAQLVLFKDCYSSEARHAFTLNGHTSDSGVVFLDCEASRDYGTSGSHQRWVTGLLYDNLVFTDKTDEPPNQALLFGNAGDNGNAHGWTSANTIAWRCDVAQIDNRIVLHDPPGPSQNYAIGTIGTVESQGGWPGDIGHVEFVEDIVDWPRSLYFAQLEKRKLRDSDAEDPSTPGELLLSEVSNNSVELSWNESTDDLGVTGYHIYRNDEFVGVTEGATFLDDTLFPNTTYTYTVAAVDVAFKESELSNAVTYSTIGDDQPPSAPSGLAGNAANSLSVELQWTESTDDFAVAYYRVFRNGQPIEETTGSRVAVAGLSPNMEHDFYVKAVDFVGRESAASNTVSILTPPSAQDAYLLIGLPFEETTGTTTRDVSRNGRDGTLVRGAARVGNGKFGRAIDFDGVDDRVSLESFDIPGSSLTLAAWVKPGSFRVSDARIISKARGVEENDHAWMLSTFNDRGIKARFRLRTESSGETNTLVGKIDLEANAWVHIAATYDGAEMKLYVNGVLDTKMPSRGEVAQFPAMPAAIGNQPQGTRPFDGLIDEVRIYTRALQSSELVALMGDSLDNSAGADISPPTVPQALLAERQSGSTASLSWNASSDNVVVQSYRIYRAGTVVGSSSSTTFVDDGLIDSSSYHYAVSALDAAGNESSQSGVASVGPWLNSEPPSAPSGLEGTALSSSQIRLTWSAAEDDGAIDQYRIFRDSSFVGASTALSFTDSGLAPSTAHDYQVLAVDDDSQSSALSEVVTVETLVGTPSDPLDNAVLNGGFESGLSNWTFYTSGVGDAAAASPAYTGENGAVLSIGASASNIQLFQNGILLYPNTEYRLTFAAYSNTGRDFRVSLNKHSSPYTNYGLSRERVDLGTGWKLHTLSFTTTNFSNPVSDGRLYFWLGDDARGGDTYYIDQVSLVAVDSYEVVVESFGQGAISALPNQGPYRDGEELTLTASAAEGWVFDRWTGDVDSDENPLRVVIDGDLVVHGLFLPEEGEVIDVWYGNEQSFGNVGIPQAQINVLGNLKIPGFIEKLEYSLNGDGQGELTFGEDVNVRLADEGDFNVEIPFTSLNEGENEIVIKATGRDGSVFSRSVTINSSIFQNWPMPYEVDWSTVTRIDEVAQVVDGKWEITEDGVRAVEAHYDRLIAIGDIEWTDYEVTVPITVHRVDPQPAPLEPLVGVLLRWTGHSQKRAGEQPGTEWRPIGAIGAFGWYEEGSRGGPRFHILETGVKKFSGYEGLNLPLNQTYLLKFRVETRDSQAPGFYSLKAWPEGEQEPVNWGITRQAEEGLLKGSLLLVAHYVDATFGNVTVTPLGPDRTGPSQPTQFEANLTQSGEVTLTWSESNDANGVAYYQVLRNGSAISEVQGNSYVDTTIKAEVTYVYQVVAYDEAGNASDPSELVSIREGGPPVTEASLWLGMGFEEDSGSAALDGSGHANHGSLVPDARRAPVGKFGKAVSFSGDGGRVDLGTLDMPSNQVTVAAWIFPESFAVHDSRILSKATGVAENDHYWMLSSINDDGIKGRVRLKAGGNTATLIGERTLPVGQWTHLAFVYDGNQLRLYVDGALDASMALSGGVAQNASVPAVIGDQPEGGRSFDGLIDEVRIYTDALGEAEILAALSEPLPLPGVSDTEPPSAPSDPTAEIVSAGTVRVSWQASSDNVGVSEYWVYRDDVFVGSAELTSLEDSSIVSGERYDYTVAAIDAAGNESEKSAVATIAVPVENQPPSTPRNVTATGISSSEIVLNWEASSDDGTVALYRVIRDGTSVGTSDTTEFIDSDLSSGTNYEYAVVAEDELGSVSSPSDAVIGSTLTDGPTEAGTNAIANGSFENGLASWTFYTSGLGDGSAKSPGFTDSRAAVISVNNRASNIQLFQNDIVLQANTEYRLTFAAYSNSGRDMRVSLGKHSSPYTNYGLNREVINLTSSWQVFTVTFTTASFSSEVSDGRLFFWFASDARAGDVYNIDQVILAPADMEAPVDTEPPSRPMNMTGSLEPGPQVALAWEASGDNVGVSYYRIVRNGSNLADVTNTNFVDTDVSGGNQYEYSIVAYDASGNASVPSVSSLVAISAGTESGENVIANGGFESGLANWTFFTSGSGDGDTESPSIAGSKSAALRIYNRASNIQLFQNGIPLEANTRYRLRFSAYSGSGRDLKVSLGKHSSPYTNYGLNRESFDLTTQWQTFTIEFTTANFNGSVGDGRLFFWLADDARGGDVYYIDTVELSPL